MSTEQTAATLQQHMAAVTQGELDTIADHYTEESVLILPDQTLHGVEQVRGFYAHLFASLPADWMANFKMIRQDVQGEVAYIFWQAPPMIPLATDTFVVRDGKIGAQTFAVLAPVA
jgi:ketosteroid isomerase-like protein